MAMETEKQNTVAALGQENLTSSISAILGVK